MADAVDKPPGKATLIVTVASLTLLAAISGALVGKTIAGKLNPSTHPAAEPAEPVAAKPLPYAGDTELRELPSIVTNLLEPSEVRVRLQVAIVFSKKAVEQPNVLAARVSDDIVAYIKTLAVTQLQGANGLQALREDLTDRAKIRSDGKVREVMIENLVIQ